MTESNNQGHGPSSSSLFKSAFFTLLGAVIVTALFVMPAEYGVDPTGVGTKLGLTDLDAAKSASEPATATELAPKLVSGAFPSAPTEEDFDYYEPEVLGDPFSRSHTAEFRTDTLEIPLDEFEHVVAARHRTVRRHAAKNSQRHLLECVQGASRRHR